MRTLASIPNLLTLSRLALAPFIFYAIITAQPVLALVLFAAAAATDALDGLLARRFGQITRTGAYIDPIADKILLSGTFVSLAAAEIVPWWLVILIFARDLFLLLSSVIALAFTKFRDFRPSVWGKASTFVQILCVTAWMAQNVPIFSAFRALAQALIWPTAAITFWSGLHYAWRGWRSIWVH